MPNLGDIQVILQSFVPAPSRSCRPVQIFYQGKTVTLKSGKNLWKTKGHAKSALRQHVTATAYRHLRELLAPHAQAEPDLAHLKGYMQTRAYEEMLFNHIYCQVQIKEV